MQALPNKNHIKDGVGPLFNPVDFHKDFDGTIEENIRYGKSDASTEEVIEAAKAAYAHDFIIEQPEGTKP